MLRVQFVQQWYALSDPAMEDPLHDIEFMCRFAGPAKMIGPSKRLKIAEAAFRGGEACYPHQAKDALIYSLSSAP